MRMILMISMLFWVLAPQPSFAALDFDVETPKELQSQFLADLEQAYALKLSRTSPLHQQIFGLGNGGDTYKNFFESHVMRVGPHNCGGGAYMIACVIM